MSTGQKYKNKDNLTPRETNFVKGIAKGLKQADAYKEAYNTKGHPNTINAEASRTANKPHVKTAIQNALDKRGITVEKIMEPVINSLNATQTANYKGKVKLSDVPDYSTRIKASNLLLKLLGVDSTDNSSPRTVNYTQINIDDLSKVNQEFSEYLKAKTS